MRSVSGLCGVVHFSDTPVPTDSLARMTGTTRYRGYAITRTGTHAHLAAQTHHSDPSLHPDSHHHLTITASARIDNRDDLIAQLRHDLPTATPTDGHLLLAAHRRWGPSTPTHLIGDYAYAIYDDVRRTLYAARDPMGMRPLYYHATPTSIAFGSEIQQILALPHVPAELHAPAVVRYLSGDFSNAYETMYRGVVALPAGHALVASPAGVTVSRFWQPDFEHEERYPNEQDYAERLRELFLRAVRDRLRTPGPHGLLLSGGVDSTSIASAVGWLSEQGTIDASMHTFSWAFDELRECDERHLSSIVVQRYGFAAHDVQAEPNGPFARYPAHGPHRDEPHVGGFQPLFDVALADAAARGITHVWSGDRGDVILGRSWPSYLALVRQRRWRELLADTREHAALTGEPVAGVLWRHAGRRWLADVVRNGWRRRTHGARGRPDDAVPPWLRAEMVEATSTSTDAHAPRPRDDARVHPARVARADMIVSGQQSHVAVWGERTHALHGLGFVDPWSDLRLAEYVIAIPQSVMNRPPGPYKRLAREALRGVMPEALRRSASKVLPTPLFVRGLRHTSRAVVEELLHEPQSEHRSYVDGAALREAYETFVAGGDLRNDFWFALTFEAWLRRHWT